MRRVVAAIAALGLVAPVCAAGDAPTPVAVVEFDSSIFPAPKDARADQDGANAAIMMLARAAFLDGEQTRAAADAAAKAISGRQTVTMTVLAEGGGARLGLGDRTGFGPEAERERAAHAAFANSRVFPGAQKVLEVFIDLNACRREFGKSFEGERGDRILEALRLCNGRAAALHGYLIDAQDVPTSGASAYEPTGRTFRAYAGPPLLALEYTWSARSENPGIVHGRSLSLRYWPGDMVKGPPPVDAPFVVVMKPEWAAAVGMALDTYRAWVNAPDGAKFDRARRGWHTRSVGALNHFAGAMPVVCLTPGDGAERWNTLEFQGEVREKMVERDVMKLIEPFDPVKEGTGLKFNEQWLVGGMEMSAEGGVFKGKVWLRKTDSKP